MYANAQRSLNQHVRWMWSAAVFVGLISITHQTVATDMVRNSADFAYEANDPPLPARFEKLLELTIADVILSCSDWPKVAEVRITYALGMSSKHRTDYQRVGARAEALRAFFGERYSVTRLPTWITMDQHLGEPAKQDSVKVDFTCWR